MAQKNRLEQIRGIIREDRKIAVMNLSNQFGVTPETIRRDLEKLEEEGLVVRTYGGAVLNQVDTLEKIDFLKRSKTNVQEKRIIGSLVDEMVFANASIGCDASSTVAEALKFLSSREDILVMTNSVKVLLDMPNSSYDIMITGGRVNRQSYSLQGGIARNTVQDYYLDIVLISCKGIGNEGGVFDSHELESDVKKMMIERGNRVILLIDHTKFGKIAFMKLTDLSKIHAIVTDREPSEEWIRLFSENEVEVFYPDKK